MTGSSGDVELRTNRSHDREPRSSFVGAHALGRPRGADREAQWFG